ncbi:methyltransferase domain-containing protein [Streptomyces flavotricini]|uniref:methyltransferase domain-containing protein n=1 Tax=Streptomyces flavotricini TaxID=66888 RepID=UPI00355705BE
MRAGLAVKPGHRVLDSSSVMLEASRVRLGAHGLPVRLVHADAHDLPFADASFAGCRIERVLRHVRDPAAVLAGAGPWTRARVLELLPRLGERRGHRGDQLCGGEQQMRVPALRGPSVSRPEAGPGRGSAPVGFPAGRRATAGTAALR